MGNHTGRAVFKTRRKDFIFTRAGEEKEWTVTEKAGMPVLKLMTGQKFAVEVDEFFITHESLFFKLMHFRTFSLLA